MATSAFYLLRHTSCVTSSVICLNRRHLSTPISISTNHIRYPLPTTSFQTTRSLASSPSLSSRPFKVLGLQQIAIGSLDKSSLSNLWCNIFGVQQIGNYKSEKENVEEDILLLGKSDSPYSVEVDLMMPIDPDKPPKVHVPPLNHIGLWVDDLPEAVKWMESCGVRFTPGGIRKGAAGHDVTFIHPKGNEKSPIGGEGVLIELVQAPKEVIEALS
jgi:lactoylglutathione lyase